MNLTTTCRELYCKLLAKFRVAHDIPTQLACETVPSPWEESRRGGQRVEVGETREKEGGHAARAFGIILQSECYPHSQHLVQFFKYFTPLIL